MFLEHKDDKNVISTEKYNNEKINQPLFVKKLSLRGDENYNMNKNEKPMNILKIN